jgi:carbon storage regulator
MLILTRRIGEAILMDGGVRVVVLGLDSNGVRLGIEAPPSVGILREEVVQRIAEENIRAGATEDAKDLLRSWAEKLPTQEAAEAAEAGPGAEAPQPVNPPDRGTKES